MTVFANVPRRRRTGLGEPPRTMEEETATKNWGEPSSLDGSELSTSSSVPAAAGDGAVVEPTKSEKERKRKGKMVAMDQSLPSAKDDAPVQLPGDKLMGDAIRGAQSHADATASSVRAKTNTKRRKCRDGVFWAGMGHDGQSTSSAGADMDVSFDKIAVVGDRLRGILKDLGASLPVRIYGKNLFKSDRKVDQNRLLMSCKSWHREHGEPFPFDVILTEEEKPKAGNDGGLPVQAYDRDGHPYTLVCKKLDSNKAYRLIKHWRRFLERYRLETTKDGRVRGPAMIELWAFRSPKLKTGVTDQPCGPLGLVMVHYRQGDAPHGDAALAEVSAAENRVAMFGWDVDGHDDDAVVEDAIHVHEDAVPVMADAVDIRKDDAVPVLEDAVDVHDDDGVPVLEDAIHVHGDAVPVLENVGDEPDEDMLEAAKAMLMLRELVR